MSTLAVRSPRLGFTYIGMRPEDIRALVGLAMPLVLTALVNTGIALTDVVMIGWLGSTALAAGAAISDFYSMLFYLAAGIIAASSPLIAYARGARRPGDVRRITRQTCWVALGLTLPGTLVIWHAGAILGLLGVDPIIVTTGEPYARMMALAFGFMLGVMVWRNFLAAHARPRAILAMFLLALPLNALGNYLLMFGVAGLPALGLAGAGLSSALVGMFLLASLTGFVLWDRRLRRYHLFVRFFRIDWARLRELTRIGLPIGIGQLGETGVFLFATVVTGILGAEALAAHTVTLRITALMYVVYAGLAQAVTVRIGYALGTGDNITVRRTEHAALAITLVLGAVFLIMLTSAAGPLPYLCLNPAATPDSVYANTSELLVLLGLMIPIFALATVTAGILRGHKDTRVPMLIAVGGYWGIGFGGGMLLGFGSGLGNVGIWIGLGTGSAAVAAGMLLRLRWLIGVRRIGRPLAAGA